VTLADACWAKSPDAEARWLSLPQHLRDAGGVAGLLWDEWLPPLVRSRLSADLKDGASARSLLCLLAGLHDLGKASPAFASDRKVRSLRPAMAEVGLSIRKGVAEQRPSAPHALVGGVAVRGWLTEVLGWSTGAADALAVVVAGHHGRPPRSLAPATSTWQELAGTGAWQLARDEVIEAAVERAGARPHLAGWARRPPSPVAQMLLTALVIVADWLASNVELFPFAAAGDGERLARAWSQLQLPRPWSPEPVDTAALAFWAGRFSFRADARPRPTQTEACRLLAAAADPRLLIIEAPMGEGKTEAALAAAELLAVRHGAGGVIVALPTMATSDAMFARVVGWLDRLPPPGAGGAWSTYLAHGKSQLNDDFRGLHRGAGSEVATDEPASAALAHRWLAGRRKGVLSSFVVGTIDQVLLGALRSKFLALRHLALAGKVVIVDEVHAADPFMSVFLTRVLAWLGAYGVPVVLLSATLPPLQREALVQAYSGGPRRRGAAPTTQSEPAGYPLITLVDGTTRSQHVVPASGRSSHVQLRPVAEEEVVEELLRALRGGGTAAVVCNTVARAQQRVHELRAVLGDDDVVLLHSRFLASDRAAIEKRVRTALGPPDDAERPHRLVVVGTQVLEQSLDIDADLMVTDLAPADLVLQRLGRLHRHERARRPAAVQDPQCWVVGVQDWSASPPAAVSGSRRVYGEAALLRSSTVLEPFLAGRPLCLPEDIAGIVADAYAPYDAAAPDPRWPAELAGAESEALGRRDEQEARASASCLRRPDAEQTSLLGWLDDGIEDEQGASGQASVRDGVQGVEIVLLHDDGGLRLPWWHADGGMRVDAALPTDAVARGVLGCAVRLPDWCSPAAEAAALSRPGVWERSSWLGDVLVVAAERVGDELHAGLGDLVLSYSATEGLSVARGAVR